MSRFFLRILTAFILLTISSCGYRIGDQKKNEIPPLTKKEYDSIRSIVLYVNLKTNKVSKIINNLIEDIDRLKDSSEIIRRQNLLAIYYIKLDDFKKADDLLNSIQRFYKNNEKWVDYVISSKIRCITLRGRKRYEEMEKILKEAISIAKEKNVKLYDLLPLHELSVFYSYDVGRFKEGIKYGKDFLKKLEKYSKADVSKKVYDSIKLQCFNVINLTLGRSYIEDNDLDSAYKHLKLAEKGFIEDNDLKKIIRVYHNLIEYYFKKGELDKFKEAKDKYLNYSLRLSSFLIASNNRITEDNMNLMNQERKSLAIKEQGKRKSLIIATLGTLILLLIIFQRYFLKLKYEKENIHLALDKEQEFKKLRASLFINIAHEIRTPLSLILGYIDLSENKNISNTELEEYLDEIKRKSNKIINNISDVIFLLKQEKEEEKIKLESLLIEPFLRQLFLSFESVAKIKNIELNYTVELPQNFYLKTNLNRLESLICNLISNAIKFSRTNSSVTFIAYLENDHFHLDVKDQRGKISEENQIHPSNNIYEKENDNAEELGIELVIVKDIVKALNGTIKIVNEENQETIFKVKFPIDKHHSVQKTETITRTIENNEFSLPPFERLFNKGYQLLVVEDNPYMVDYYEKILSKTFRCDFAFNGEEGIEKLSSKEYDLIISDVMMPKMDGIEFRKKMNDLSMNQRTPFIIVTALKYEENKIEAFNIGIDDYIIKPFNKNELIARINCLIENKQKREGCIQLSDKIEEKVETYDEKKLRELKEIIIENIHREDFSVTDLVEIVNSSQRQLERVIKKLTGLTPVKFILEIRLQEAYKKIRNKEEADINNVRYSIGMKSASYFSIKFKERFGIRPSELLKGNHS